jgi:ABC-2 type transport system permease protein
MKPAMNLKTIRAIVRREFVERIRTRAFAAMTILLPGLMGISMLIPMLARPDGPSLRVIGISDATGVFAETVRAAFEDEQEGGTAYIVQPVGTISLDDARDRVRWEEYDALLLIPEDVFTSGHAQYIAHDAPHSREVQRIRSVLSNQVASLMLWRAGVPREDIEQITRGVSITQEVVPRNGAYSPEAAMLGATVMAMLMYFTLILYGAWTLRGVIRDKTSRIIEILISTTSPTELMIGKIVGIGSVGLVQIAIWLSALAIGALLLPDMQIGVYIRSLPGMIFPAFFIYYIAGYLLYATLYAGVGAISANEDDAQQFQWPILLLLMVPIFLLSIAIAAPDRPFVVVASYVPFFSPVIMLCRILLGSAGWGAFALSVAILLLSTAVFAWLAGRLFRIGVLMTGRHATMREILRFLRDG